MSHEFQQYFYARFLQNGGHVRHKRVLYVFLKIKKAVVNPLFAGLLMRLCRIGQIAKFGDASSIASNCQLKTNGLNNFLLSLVVLHGTGIFTYMNG